MTYWLLAGAFDNIVAAGLLRLGYKDAQSEVSAGGMGYAIGDNSTPEVVDDVDAVIRQLRSKYRAGKVVLVGHSGGGAITAD